MKNFKEYLFLSIAATLLSVSVFLSYSATAQDKTFTIDEAVSNGGGKLVPKNADQLQWIANSSLYSIADGNSFMIKEAKNSSLVKSVSKNELVVSFRKAFPDDDTLKKLPRITWLNASTFKYNLNNKIYAYDYQKKETKFLAKFNPLEMENADIDPTTNKVAYTVGNNIFLDGKQITFDTKAGFVNGQAVHRSEFGITKGLFWNNDGKQLAFYHVDESMVAEYPIYELENRPATARTIRYPIAGTPSHHALVGVYNTESGTTVFLKTGEPLEQYLTNITWSPDNKSIYTAIVNRAQNHLWLNQYDVATGNFVKTLFEETDTKYVEPEHGPLFVKNDPSKFIWWSERDGFNHLYLYDITGNILKQLTKGNWVVTDIQGFDKSGNTLFYTSTVKSPKERHLQSVNLKSDKTILLNNTIGTHTSTLSPNGDFFIDQLQNTTTPREIRIVTADGKKENLVFKAENPLLDYSLGEIEMGTLSAEDGTPLYYRMIKPINFSANKKYPVVVYLYNGPHLQLVNNTWMAGSNLWMQYMAQHGYIVFSIDGRGSLNRGLAFENAIFRQAGTVEMQDQLKGVEYLKSLAYVDGSRLGIHGWSYGGFMTTSMMTRQAGVFKVGVAGGPVIDWGLYEIMYTERYMDTPEENPEGYKNANLLNYIKNLQGKLLMIHGGQDDVVLWQHSLQYLEKAIKDGVQMDYFVYPQHPHNVSGKDRIHLMDKVSRYFFDNL